MLDQSRTDAVGALVDEAMAEAAIAASARKGYLDGRRLAEVFAWLRPGDLIWNYWVNNYLLGREPAKFDILFWNADTTRMTAGLHRDFVRAALANPLATPGGLTVLGTEIDLAQVDLDSYVVAGVADHICPWQSCYRSSQLLGGKTRFVLSTSGHIAALVNPADSKKSRYQASDDVSADAEAWQQAAATEQGLMVAGLRLLAGRPFRRPGAGPGGAGQRPLPRPRGRPWQLRACGMRRKEADVVKTVTAGGRRLRVAVRPGAGDGPPLLVCNGIGTPLEALEPFTAALDPAITVVRFDVPGAGGSAPTRLPYSVPWLAWLTGRMMTALGYRRFDVLGISWGGGLAQQLAVQYPRRCRRLVLVATSTGSLMIPARPRSCCTCPRRARHRDPAHAARIAGDDLRRRPAPPAELAAPLLRSSPGRRRGAATSTSCWPRPPGPACRGFRWSGSRR